MMTARCMTKAEAAAYCKVTARGFESWMARGIVPGPLPGTHRWDVRALDAALDRLSGLAPTPPVTATESVDDAGESQDEVRQRYLQWKRRRDEKRA